MRSGGGISIKTIEAFALAIPFIGTAKGIGNFYRTILGAPTRPITGDSAGVAVLVGKDQYFIFRETERGVPHDSLEALHHAHAPPPASFQCMRWRK